MLTILNSVSPSCWESFCKLFSASPFEFITMLIAGISAILAFLAYRHQRNQVKKAESCKLSNHYAKTIVDRACYLLAVYDDVGFVELVKKFFPINEISDFTRAELINMLETLSEEERDDLYNKFLHISPEIIFRHKIDFCTSQEERSLYTSTYELVEEKLRPLTGSTPESLVSDFDSELSGLINDLESFSMTCRYRIADEGILYQSLHQTFLSSVQMFYMYISLLNVNGEDKYYTNVIWLFNKWKKRLKKYKKKNNRAKKRADRRLFRITQKVKRAGDITHHGRPV